MKRALCVFTFLAVLAVAASALAWKKPPFPNVDANHDGVITFEEIRIFNPNGMTMAVFAIIDRNKDGTIDRAEYAAMLSDLSLHERDNWRLGLRLGLVNLRAFRLREGLEELRLAGVLADKRGETHRFVSALDHEDTSGAIRRALARDVPRAEGSGMPPAAGRG